MIQNRTPIIMAFLLAFAFIAVAHSQVENQAIYLDNGAYPGGQYGSAVSTGATGHVVFNIDFSGNNWCGSGGVNPSPCEYKLVWSNSQALCPSDYSNIQSCDSVPWTGKQATQQPYCLMDDAQCSSGTFCHINSGVGTPPSAAPGAYGLCYWINTNNHGTYNSPIPEYNSLVPPQSDAPAYIVSPATPPSSNLGLTISPTTAAAGQQVNIQLSGDSYFPLYLEFSNPSAGPYGTPPSPNNYCIDPSPQYSGGPSGALPTCTLLTPTTSDCSLGYTGSTGGGAPQPGSPVAVVIDTSGLQPGVYNICGYEGNTHGNDPFPKYFINGAFTVVCPFGSIDPTTGKCNYQPYQNPSPPVSVNPIRQTGCNLYSEINTLLLLLALVIMLIGGLLYGASYSLPGSSRDTARGFAQGLFIAGLVSVLIAVITVGVLTLVTSTPVNAIIAQNCA